MVSHVLAITHEAQGGKDVVMVVLIVNTYSDVVIPSSTVVDTGQGQPDIQAQKLPLIMNL